MSYWDRKVDANQKKIDETWEKAGALVIRLHRVGQNVPDRAVVFRGTTYWIEIKNPENKAKSGKLSQGQAEMLARINFHGGKVAVVRTAEEALIAIGAM